MNDKYNKTTVSNNYANKHENCSKYLCGVCQEETVTFSYFLSDREVVRFVVLMR